jgi:hypothetical protein
MVPSDLAVSELRARSNAHSTPNRDRRIDLLFFYSVCLTDSAAVIVSSQAFVGDLPTRSYPDLQRGEKGKSGKAMRPPKRLFLQRARHS